MDTSHHRTFPNTSMLKTLNIFTVHCKCSKCSFLYRQWQLWRFFMAEICGDQNLIVSCNIKGKRPMYWQICKTIKTMLDKWWLWVTKMVLYTFVCTFSAEHCFIALSSLAHLNLSSTFLNIYLEWMIYKPLLTTQDEDEIGSILDQHEFTSIVDWGGHPIGTISCTLKRKRITLLICFVYL